ncbi:MAG: DUF3854 domain-containing protein [Chloroflexi bacterium]|nr:DUF3854 domain-containing protein [Chloroflexota bacterium]
MTLLPHHADLITASAITPAVAEARGYRSEASKAELERFGFSKQQRRTPTLLIPVWNVRGEIATYQSRPDVPRVDGAGRTVKYETPGGARMVLDVPPFARDEIPNPSVPLFITEGIRKADSAGSHGICCVAVLGVWSWRGTNADGGRVALADWESVALQGRRVYVCFDSDVMAKPEAHEALARLAAFLSQRKADVAFVYLPAFPDGAKRGLDDYLAAGHDVDDMLALASPTLRRPDASGRDQSRAPYEATDAGLIWRKPTQNGLVDVALTNFSASIVSDTERDDGSGETTRSYEMRATLRGRERAFSTSAAQFGAMNWPADRLGATAIVFPGQTAREHARVAIQTLSGDIPERHVYAHTGWRFIDDAWRYLHGAGAIGADGPSDGIDVELTGAMARYALPDPPTGSRRTDAIRASLALRHLAPDAVMIPLLAAAYLAPLRELLGPETPDFTAWLHGPTGELKSELAVLALDHFGTFTRLTVPATFRATANAVERVLFAAKDALALIDDYHPAADPREANAMAQVAACLLRGVGNGTGRPRMRPDTTLRPELRPRCVALATGERLPEGHSNAARMLPIPVAPGSVNLERLTEAQRDTSALASAMAGYVQWIAGHFNALAGALPARFRELRAQAQPAATGHARSPGQVAHLYLGLETWCRFAVEAGAMNVAEAEALLTCAWEVFVALDAQRAGDLAGDTPSARFLDLLTDGFASRRVYLETATGAPPADAAAWGWERRRFVDSLGDERFEWRHDPGARLLGTVDEDWLQLYPEAAYQFVASAARSGGQVFPVEPRTLLKRLDEAGLIAIEPGSGRRTVNVWMNGHTRRVIKLRRDAAVPSPSPENGEFGEGGERGAWNGESTHDPSLNSFPEMPGDEIMGKDFGEGAGTESRVLPDIPPIPRNPGGMGPAESRGRVRIEWDGRAAYIIEVGGTRLPDCCFARWPTVELAADHAEGHGWEVRP